MSSRAKKLGSKNPFENEVPKKPKEIADALMKNWAGPMTEKEVAFLRDVEGLVRFAIRNGLSFQTVVRVLHADLSHFALASHDASYDEALADGYLPMVTGYRKLTESSFGDSPEEEPGDQ